MAKTKKNNSKEEPIEKQLWKAADKLRKNIDAAEYKHIVLGLIFLKYISDAFEGLYTKLKNGDQILIGKHTLIFALHPDEIQEDSKLTEETMFIEVAQGASEPSVPDSQASDLASPAVSAEGPAVIAFVTGGNGEYELAKKLVKLGKDEEADVRVGGLFTPKVAATISKRPTGYHLTPTSRAKVKVNDVQIEGSHRLEEFDTIEIGSAKLQFYYRG